MPYLGTRSEVGYTLADKYSSIKNGLEETSFQPVFCVARG